MKTPLLSLLVCCLAIGPVAQAASFSNPTAISLNEPAAPLPPTAGSPYPSTILVSGLPGTISKVVVRLNGLSHNRADDMDVLLVGPTGARFVLQSDAGGTAVPVVNATVTFNDAAATQIPDTGPLATGTFRPSSYNPGTADVFPAPAPAGPHSSAAPEGAATLASLFNGTDPNGTWSLYVADDIANGGQVASVAGGWTLEITTVPDLATTTTVTSAPNPSFTTAPDNAVTFTATVTSGGSPVTVGTVTFQEGATVLQAAAPVDGNGQAQFVTSTLSAGTHVIVAQYDGSPGAFNVSSGSTVQDVDHHTIVSGNTYCNPGAIDFADSGSPGVAKNLYPSHIFVSGAAGTIASVSLKLNGINHPRPDDIDLLLVAPNGAKLVVMSDSGGTLAAANVNLTLSDSAATALPDPAPLVSGTFRPSSYTPTNDPFPAPAPAGPHNVAASDGTATLTSVFAGASPNGTWTLYVVDDVANAGQVASIANGWCLEFVLNQPPVPPTVTCPANITVPNTPGQCSASVTFMATATGTPTPTIEYKIGATTITSPHVFPVGTTTVDVTAQNSGGTATCSFTVTVNDTEAPTIVCPANISVGTSPGQCSAVVNFTVNVIDNCPGATVMVTPASGSVFPVGTTTVNATATDASGNTAMCSFTVTVTNPAPVVSITGPASGSVFAVGAAVNFSGTFTDNAGDVHTAQWTFTSGSQTLTQAGVVDEGAGTVTATSTFNSAGVYLVTLKVTDVCGSIGTANTIGDLTALIVIYDPNGGFVTGGGWITSPAGAYVANPALTGKASFGFVSKYQQGATIPTGDTEFQFRAADFNFSSTAYDWLVVAGAKAQYKGTGTVNGSGNYGFLLKATDGQANGGGGTDKFRIKIWDKNNNDAVVYDNQINDSERADPTTTLGGGNIVVSH